MTSQCWSLFGPTVTAKCSVWTVYGEGVAASAGTSASGVAASAATRVNRMPRCMRKLQKLGGYQKIRRPPPNSCRSGELELRALRASLEVEQDPLAVHAAPVAGQ